MEVKTRLTTEEFFKLYPEESRVELINGEVYEMPAPNVSHQRVLFYLSRLIHEHLTVSKLQGEVFIAPVDVVFSEELVLQPDIVYLSDLSKVKDKIYSAPDLVVEVVSPSTLKRDLTDKMKLYERHGVKEYWLVFPLEKTIMVYELTEKGYELFSSATEKGKVKSRVLEGFESEVEEVFEGL
ncbi:Uma2 family endonuclease [Hydrogenobacter sp. T-2]|uniref:Uma2 family endonuclease n=1 Tax=Pampinifervens diazotrophicum TaxID=1632018 RepID=UPI002B25C3C2|nr:Uma2 family endonuclease [Hydrogenobacter sp. T-2]WPM32982.1 Uma2 family endonuclease [Hydrogenobacter sp. T-2]